MLMKKKKRRSEKKVMKMEYVKTYKAEGDNSGLCRPPLRPHTRGTAPKK